MSRFAASHLGLFCLPMAHEKDARLTCVWVKVPDKEKWLKIMPSRQRTPDMLIRLSGCAS